ncbi:MAG: hypothetical protein AB7O44_20805 [Hyphomicrobiaceae bacterium]
MTQILRSRVVVIAAALILALPGFYFVYKFAETLTTFEKVATIAYPVILGLAFYVLTDLSTRRVLETERAILAGLIDRAVRDVGANQARVFSTKKTVDGGSEYWNALARRARRRLAIIGTTNKSWFNKDAEQSSALLSDFKRITMAGGTVSVLSINRKDNIEMMTSFMAAADAPAPHKCFEYGVVRDLNFAAVLADDVLVLMPLPHEDKFREETMVIEITERQHPHIFFNYVSDIERVIKTSTIIDLLESAKSN